MEKQKNNKKIVKIQKVCQIFLIGSLRYRTSDEKLKKLN